MGKTVADDSPVWFHTLEAIQVANWCDAAAVALVCYDSVLMFPREVEYVWRKRWTFMSTFYVIVRYLGIALAFNFWAFSANISMSPSQYATFGHYIHADERVAADRFANFGTFVNTVVGDAIMAIRIYSMYLGSRLVLVVLIAIVLTRIAVGLAVAVVIYGPKSGISATEWILSGIYVCDPDVNTASLLPFAWNITAIVVSSILFLLTTVRFLQHALEVRRMINRWRFDDLMGMLAKDSIVYFFLNLLATILMMIAVWGIPNNATFFAIITAYTQNELSVIIPRLVISFREHFRETRQGGNLYISEGGGDGVQQTILSGKMMFERRVLTMDMTDEFELQSVEQEQTLIQAGGEQPV